ncbi:MAG TPA: hypothetical protein VID24_08045 [Candidatus Eremiobacteraceae bacterium]
MIGFLCGLAIGVTLVGSTAIASSEAQRQLASDALRSGGLLGAIYLPAAVLFLAPRKVDARLVGVACVAAIVFGIVGDAAMGPWAPPSVAASFGFWLTIFAIYQRDHRSKSAGRGSLLP